MENKTLKTNDNNKSLPIPIDKGKDFIQNYICSGTRIIKDFNNNEIYGFKFDSNDIRSCIDDVTNDPATQNDVCFYFGIDNTNHLKLIAMKFDITTTPGTRIPETARMYEYSEPIYLNEIPTELRKTEPCV